MTNFGDKNRIMSPANNHLFVKKALIPLQMIQLAAHNSEEEKKKKQKHHTFKKFLTGGTEN